MQPSGLHASFGIYIVDIQGALRLEARVKGEAPQRPSVQNHMEPLRAARVLALVAPRIPGALYHPRTQRFTFPMQTGRWRFRLCPSHSNMRHVCALKTKKSPAPPTSFGLRSRVRASTLRAECAGSSLRMPLSMVLRRAKASVRSCGRYAPPIV